MAKWKIAKKAQDIEVIFQQIYENGFINMYTWWLTKWHHGTQSNSFMQLNQLNRYFSNENNTFWNEDSSTNS